MGDVTRALVGLEDFEVTGAVETAAGVLEVSVRVARPDAACQRCGTFSSRVKEYRTCRVRDGLSYERPTVLVWTKRRFGCETPGCVRSFTESTRRGAASAPCGGPVVRGDRPRCCGPLDGGGGAVVPGGLGDGVAGHRRGGSGQARPPPRGAAAAVGRRRDDVPSLQELHDRPGGLGEFPVVGLHRGPVQESAGRPPRSARRGCAQHRGGGDRPLRRLQGRRARRGAPSDPRRRPLPHRGSRQRGAHRRANPTPTGNHRPPRPQRRPSVVGAPRPAAGAGTSHRPRLGAPRCGVPSGLVRRTRMRLDAQGDAPRPLHQRRPRHRRSRTGTTTPAPSTSPRRTASPRPSAPGNPNCSPTSTPASPTGPPKASTGSSKPSNAKASATPTPTTTASASSTAAPDTLRPPDNRTPAAPPNA